MIAAAVVYRVEGGLLQAPFVIFWGQTCMAAEGCHTLAMMDSSIESWCGHAANLWQLLPYCNAHESLYFYYAQKSCFERLNNTAMGFPTCHFLTCDCLMEASAWKPEGSRLTWRD